MAQPEYNQTEKRHFG